MTSDMLLALGGRDGGRIEPSPRAKGRCPQCGAEVLAKCGTLVAWHWAHRSMDCDPWSEGESAWHRDWKLKVEPDAREVVVGEHRADIHTSDGLVVELQHSALDEARIREREAFYQHLVWLFDARSYELAFYPRGAQVAFEWSRPRKSLLSVSSPMYWDLGWGFVLHVETLGLDSALGGVRGRGVLLDSTCFASSIFGASAQREVHKFAQTSAQRVAACSRLTLNLLEETPSLGLDCAFRQAMKAI